MSNNYQPAEWLSNTNWSPLESAQQVVDGCYGMNRPSFLSQSAKQAQPANLNQLENLKDNFKGWVNTLFNKEQQQNPDQQYAQAPLQNAPIHNAPLYEAYSAPVHLGRPTQTFIDRFGRKCHVVCEPQKNHHQRPNPNNLIGMPINRARQYYPNIRVVIQDGNHLMVTQDFRKDRLNVETQRGIITRTLGFY